MEVFLKGKSLRRQVLPSQKDRLSFNSSFKPSFKSLIYQIKNFNFLLLATLILSRRQ